MKKLLISIIFGILFAFIIAAVVTFWQTSNDKGQWLLLLAVAPLGFGVFGITLSRLLY